ncbi:MAG: type I-E CRISPR-associated protein Cse2/CasB [Candidatus Methanoplasma sp.]|jgi:CRISPR system Cascade subunit CasB|nr:type I-E CRISPR-associated protein Cse2/CasB [Candidatus Methanoplasma sp.]
MGEAEQIYVFVGGKIALLRRADPWARGILAELRRGVGKDLSDTPGTWDIMFDGMPDFPGSGVANKAELAIHTALTLYSLHQQSNDVTVSAKDEDVNRKSFATGCRRLISPGGKSEQAVKRRFDALITADSLTEFSYHARGFVQMMRTSDVPILVDYPQLAKDLYFYQFPEGKKRVLLKWGRDFYRVKSDNTK